MPDLCELACRLPSAWTTSPIKPKGKKVPVRIEFEQKFLLDHRRSEQLLDTLCVFSATFPIVSPKADITVCKIRQFYDEGDRFRCSSDIRGSRSSKCVKEKKKSIHLGASYSANTEEEEEVSEIDFDKGWRKANRRLQKIRFYVPSVHPDHRTVVDFFYTMRNTGICIYAAMAEDEAMLEATTTSLYLRFELPIYLHDYLLCVVDGSDPEMKSFRSANMIDTPDAIAAYERAISRFYGNSA